MLRITLDLSDRERAGFSVWLRQTLALKPNASSSTATGMVNVDMILESLLAGMEVMDRRDEIGMLREENQRLRERDETASALLAAAHQYINLLESGAATITDVHGG